MQAGLTSNIWKYAAILVANKRVFAAILGAYYLTVPGVTPFWIGLFMLVGNGASLIFDIPSSYIADKIGHKEAIVLSRGILVLSTLFFLFADSIGWLIVASFLLSMGFAFLSGVGSAFMHETLRGLGREQDYRTVMGKVSSIGFFVPALMAVLIPFTVSVSYKLPFLVGLVLDIIGLLVALFLVRPRVAPEHAAEVQNTNYVEVVRQGRALKFFRVTFFSSVISAILFSVDSFRAPYQMFLSVPVVWFGVFFGIGRVLAALLLANSGRIHRWVGNLASFYRLELFIYGLLLLVLGLTTDPWVAVVVLILDNGLRYGLAQVDGGYQLDIIRDNRFKATLLSTANQFQNVLTMLTVVGMGALIELIGYRQTFLVAAGLFSIVLIPLYIWISRTRPGIA